VFWATGWAPGAESFAASVGGCAIVTVVLIDVQVCPGGGLDLQVFIFLAEDLHRVAGIEARLHGGLHLVDQAAGADVDVVTIDPSIGVVASAINENRADVGKASIRRNDLEPVEFLSQRR